MPPTNKKAETPAVEAEPIEAEPVEDADTLFADIQCNLLRVVRNAVDPGTDYGVDIVLAQQVADVYQKLFGATR